MKRWLLGLTILLALSGAAGAADVFTGYTNAAAVTTSDSATIRATGALYIGGAGNVTVVMAGEGNTTVTFSAVPVGTILPISVKQVKATGTTATLIIALR